MIENLSMFSTCDDVNIRLLMAEPYVCVLPDPSTYLSAFAENLFISPQLCNNLNNLYIPISCLEDAKRHSFHQP